METFTIIIGILIVSVTLLTGYRLYIRSKEQHYMIEKGLDPSLLNIYSKQSGYGKLFLYAGILLLGIATGISCGILLAHVLDMPGETKELMLLSLIVWTGVSCIICYYVSDNKDKS